MGSNQTKNESLLKEAYRKLLSIMEKSINPIEIRLYPIVTYVEGQRIGKQQTNNPYWLNEYVRSLQRKCLGQILLKQLVDSSMNPDIKIMSAMALGSKLHKGQAIYAKKYFRKRHVQIYVEMNMKNILQKLTLYEKTNTNAINTFIKNNLGLTKNLDTATPDLIVMKEGKIIVFDLTSKYDCSHFKKTISYAFVLHQAYRMNNISKDIKCAEIYWRDNAAATLLTDLGEISSCFKREEIPVDPWVMDNLSEKDFLEAGKKNPYALGGLDSSALMSAHQEIDDLGNILKQINLAYNNKSITTEEINNIISILN